jgi:hypothetical protein
MEWLLRVYGNEALSKSIGNIDVWVLGSCKHLFENLRDTFFDEKYSLESSVSYWSSGSKDQFVSLTLEIDLCRNFPVYTKPTLYNEIFNFILVRLMFSF